MAAAAGVALAGGSVQRLYQVWSGELPDVVARPVQAAADVVLALVLVLPRHRSARLWGLVLVIPMYWLATAGLDLIAALLR